MCICVCQKSSFRLVKLPASCFLTQTFSKGKVVCACLEQIVLIFHFKLIYDRQLLGLILLLLFIGTGNQDQHLQRHFKQWWANWQRSMLSESPKSQTPSRRAASDGSQTLLFPKLCRRLDTLIAVYDLILKCCSTTEKLNSRWFHHVLDGQLFMPCQCAPYNKPFYFIGYSLHHKFSLWHCVRNWNK